MFLIVNRKKLWVVPVFGMSWTSDIKSTTVKVIF